METKKPILRQEMMMTWTMVVVVGTERSRQLYFEGRIIRTSERTDMEGEWKEKPKVTSKFLALNKWKDESAFNEDI